MFEQISPEYTVLKFLTIGHGKAVSRARILETMRETRLPIDGMLA